MKRIILVFFIIISVLVMSACSSQECTCTCCNKENIGSTAGEIYGLNISQENEIMNEETEIQDSCENPIDASHYPYVESHSKGSVGSIAITTSEHGNLYDINYNTIFTGLVEWTGKKCHSTAEKATKNPITVTSRGHEIIITLTYENNSESFTLNAGDSKLLSISHSNFPSTKAYAYVIVK